MSTRRAEPAETDANPETGPTRIQIVFDESAMRTLAEVKAAYGSAGASTATVIRDALGLFSWAQKEIRQGSRIAVVDASNKVREVVLPFQLK